MPWESGLRLLDCQSNEMHDFLISLVIYSFLLFPPILLIFRFTTRKPPWRVINLLVLLFSLLGWSLVFYAYAEEQTRTQELLEQQRYDELPHGWDSDGASGVFALFLGWLVPLAYFMLWLTVYALAATIRKVFGSNRKRMDA
ncbi:MAG: hypothetical protein KDI88_02680 [Gammaproteobacteria bacterium]|nr:hypothetical protein [Gammaproteobacteria bacterium]